MGGLLPNCFKHISSATEGGWSRLVTFYRVTRHKSQSVMSEKRSLILPPIFCRLFLLYMGDFGG